MGGGEGYEGFPVPNPTTSYWQLPPHRLANHRTTLDLPTQAVWDYILVGSGISGASIAYKLLHRNPNTRILMLEARTAASGASGRNGGHCRGGFWLDFKTYCERFGEDEALKFEALEEGNIADIASFVKEHEIDCDFQDVETSDLCLTKESWTKILQLQRFRQDVEDRRPGEGRFVVRKVWEGRAAQEHMGIDKLIGAVTYPAHTQNPYRLVCSILEKSIEKGLNLQTNTLALDINPTKDVTGKAKWVVRTERGLVCAERLVLATNAYTNTLYPKLAETKFLSPSRSQVAAIRPGSRATGNPALRGTAGVEPGDYFMCRAPGLEGEGDILYGGGRRLSPTREMGITDDSRVNPKIAEYLHRAPSELFGRDSWGKDGDVVRDWSGITCYTPDTFPLVGESPCDEGLWMSVGMNGHGMAMAFRCAEALVEMMTNGSEPTWFPKPLRLERAWHDEKSRRKLESESLDSGAPE